MTVDEKYMPKIVLASIDLLGTKSFFNLLGPQSKDSTYLAMESLTSFVRNAYENRAFGGIGLGSDFLQLHDVTLHFGDSVYLIPNESLSLDQQATRLIASCARLIALGFVLGPVGQQQKYLARAGISIGDLLERKIQVDTGTDDNRTQTTQQTIRIGSATVKSHLLENDQNWFGGAVSNDVPIADQESNLLRYDVPLKPKAKSDGSSKAINWLSPLKADTDLMASLSDIAAPKDCVDDSVIQKYQNAREFIRHIIRMKPPVGAAIS